MSVTNSNAFSDVDVSALEADTSAELERFDATERAHRDPKWMQPLREEALARFARVGFPTRRHEEWRATSLKRIVDGGFTPFAANEPESAPAELPFSLDDSVVVHVVNGRVANLDAVEKALPKGVRLRSLGHLDARPSGAANNFLRLAESATQMADLNTALFDDVVVIEIEAEAVVDTVLHLAHSHGRDDGDAVALAPRVFLSLGEGAKARVIETFSLKGDAGAFANAVSEVDLAKGAHLEHVYVHDAGEASNLVLTTAVRQAAESSYTERGFWLSCGLVRHDLQVTLAEETAVCSLDGLALTRGNSLVDGHYAVEHAVGNNESAQRFRTVLDDKSVAVFNGKVVMREGADKSDAQQENHNLLLSRDAEVFAKPQLEIFADDVKASHGSTVGQLDEAALFYLRARGIGFDDAQRLLITAFAKSLVDDVQLEDMADKIRALVDARLVASVGDLEGGSK